MSRIVPSELVVTDGESGFEKAYEKIWPDFRVRQCMFHAFSKAKEAAMRRSTLPASTELYALGKQVIRVAELSHARCGWRITRRVSSERPS